MKKLFYFLIISGIILGASVLVFHNKKAEANSKSLITPSDLTWLGAWKTPADAIGPYSRPALGLRYVNGERRFLMVEWSGDAAIPGDLVELTAPANPTLYTGADMANAQPMRVTRRWAATDWKPSWVTSANYPSAGPNIGSLYWDDATGLLWFSVYDPYGSGQNLPIWGAVQLLDTVKTGSYYNVGSQYGPWYYHSSVEGTSWTLSPYCRGVNQWIIPVPAGEQPLINGAKFLIGAGHAGFDADASWGPTLHVLADLSTSMPNPVPLVKQLAEYTTLSPLGVRHGARRDGSNYYSTFDPGGYNEVINGEGVWYGGDSNVKGIVWVDTGTKHGVVMFGAEAQGGVGYWHNNPTIDSTDSSYLGLRDPSVGICTGCLGPKATEHYLWLRIFDPNNFAEVFAGTRNPYADTYEGLPGMRFAYEVNMRQNVTNGANIPTYHISRMRTGALEPPVDGPDTDFQGAVWDATAQQIIWMQYGASPDGAVLSFFSVNGSSNPPSTKQGDLNSDGKVDIFDYNILIGNFGRTGAGIVGDINSDGKVDIFDYNILVGNFGK